MTVQLELTPSALAVSRHGDGVTLAVEPAGWLVKLKLTVPCGAVLVPESVSATLTVQVAGLLAGVESGQSSVVEVERTATVVVAVAVLLAVLGSEVDAELTVAVLEIVLPLSVVELTWTTMV